ENIRCNGYPWPVAIKKDKYAAPSLEEAIFLDLLRTTDLLSRGLAEFLKTEELSPTQYNVLRILRGAPEGLACGEVADRMITRDRAVPRLLDRLEKRGLVGRSRLPKDRRTVVVRSTSEGLRLLSRMDKTIQEAHRRQLGHLGPQNLR